MLYLGSVYCLKWQRRTSLWSARWSSEHILCRFAVVTKFLIVRVDCDNEVRAIGATVIGRHLERVRHDDGAAHDEASRDQSLSSVTGPLFIRVEIDISFWTRNTRTACIEGCITPCPQHMEAVQGVVKSYPACTPRMEGLRPRSPLTWPSRCK
jgi:hypothetical protein